MLKKYRFRDFRIRLVAYILVLSFIGILAIGSANASFQAKQVIGVIGGTILMLIVSVIDYEYFVKYSRLFYLLAVLLLAVVLVAGQNVNGATRWIMIGGEGGIQFQPSEFAKIFLIIFFSAFLMKYRETLNTWKTLLMAIILFAVPAALIFKEPNLSTTIITGLIFVTLLFIAGLSYKIILGVLAVCIPAGILGIVLIVKDILPIHDYQRNRVMAWIDPSQYSDNAYQTQYSIRAIGSGRLWGKGLYNHSVLSVKNGHFISEPQTDFIYAVIGEEMGFIGCVIILILLALIVVECIMVARNAKNLSGRLIACGVAGWVGFQTFVNISVATGLMPNTGVPLPFVSYGLTSLVSLFIAMGIVLNIGLQARRYGKGDVLE